MATHPHSASQPAGSKDDKHNRLDGSHAVGHTSAIGKAFGAFGAFAPMIQHAPILAVMTPRMVVSCPSCSAGIMWDGAPVLFACQGCGGTVDGKTLQGQ